MWLLEEIRCIVSCDVDIFIENIVMFFFDLIVVYLVMFSVKVVLFIVGCVVRMIRLVGCRLVVIVLNLL